MFFLFWNKQSVLLLLCLLPFRIPAFHSTLGLRLHRLWFFPEIPKAFDELLREKGLVLEKPILLAAKSRAFDVLYFELDGP